jgi:exopolyphosphatase/guanosine-5'-triphosphate,3'-diphosphate pyrophosphatase
MKIAILDLGTNTFNLLIAETPDDKELKIIHSSKHPVKLGKGGITRKIITEDAFARGLSAIDNQYEIINQFNVEKVYAFATSAIRDAGNGKDFIRKVKDRFSLYVNIIPGEREAELIYKGVRLSYNPGDKKVLILDIGGGSNMSCHSRSAPIRARVCSIWMVPRSRHTSEAPYGRLIPAQRLSYFQLSFKLCVL